MFHMCQYIHTQIEYQQILICNLHMKHCEEEKFRHISKDEGD